MNTAAASELWLRTRAALIADCPDIDPETLRDTLEGMSDALDIVASLIRDSQEDKAQALGLKEYIDALSKRQHRLNDRAAKRKAAALRLMQEIGEKRLVRPDFTLVRSPGPQGARITDEAALPPWAWRQPSPVLDTKAIRERLLAGEAVPGATLSNGEEHLRVLT